MLTVPYDSRLFALPNALFGGLSRFRRSKSTPPPPVATSAAPVRAGVPGAGPGMTCVRTDEGSTIRLSIEGELDIHSAPELRAVLRAVLAAAPEVVALDLSGLDMIDSSGVGAIVSLFKQMKDRGGRLEVRGVRGQPLAVCKLLKLDRVFGF